MKQSTRERFLQLISENIKNSGRHIYSVMGGESPRYLYTIGLAEKRGLELVLPGFAHLSTRFCAELLNQIADGLENGGEPSSWSLEHTDLGQLSLCPVHDSWATRLLLGATDYYGHSEFKAWQIVAEQERSTIDVPNLSLPYSRDTQPVWQWLDGGWPYQVSSDSVAVTNLDALRGYGISELVRWEELEWEMFSGPAPEIPENELFKVPLATLLAFDPTLVEALDLPLGEGLFRHYEDDGPGPWKSWKRRTP